MTNSSYLLYMHSVIQHTKYATRNTSEVYLITVFH